MLPRSIGRMPMRYKVGAEQLQPAPSLVDIEPTDHARGGPCCRSGSGGGGWTPPPAPMPPPCEPAASRRGALLRWL